MLEIECQEAEKQVYEAFDKVRAFVDERQAEILNELETKKHQKQKALKLQKEELEMIKSGIEAATSLTQATLKDGTDVEILVTENQLKQRLTHLKDAKLQMQPVKNGKLSFITTNLDSTVKAIKSFGFITNHSISADKSYLEGHDQIRNNSLLIDTLFTFKMIALDDKGEKLQQATIHDFEIDIIGPSNTKV